MADKRICSIPGCGKRHYGNGFCKSHNRRFALYGHPLTSLKKARQFCSVDGCDAPCHGHGFCLKHYRRWEKHGDPTVKLCAAGGEPEAWLKEHADHTGDNCLFWPFGQDAFGYASKVTVNGRADRAHRHMCEVAKGPSPSSAHVVAHSCGNGDCGCVNPKHLRWATRSENEADKVAHGTSNRGERCGTAKLTRADVVAIRRLAKSLTHRVIAARFGISRRTVSQIISRNSWAWLE